MQAPAYGAAALLLIGDMNIQLFGHALTDVGIARETLGTVLSISLALHLLIVLGETVFLPAHSSHLAAVKRLILNGPHSAVFYGIVLIMGGLVPMTLALSQSPISWYAAAALSLIGLYAWDHIWVHVGQEVPLS